MTETVVPLLLLADAGIPMIFLTFPLMLILLIPVIVIEGFLCRKWLGLTTWEAIKSNTAANLASTVVGVPIAWTVMFGVEMGAMGLASQSSAIENSNSPLVHLILFILSSAWIGPPEGTSVWVVPCAILVLLVPFFFASYGVEYLVTNHMLGMPEGGPPNRTSRRVRIAVRNANLVTYGLMAIGTTVWIITSLPHH